MTTRNTQQISRAGIAPTYNAAASGDKFRPDERTYLHVKNADSSSHTITIVTPGTQQGLAIADLAVVVVNATERVIGPFPAGLFADPADGLAAITWSATTSMTWAVLRL